MSVAAYAAARQPSKATRCHHSREPFHALFAVIAERTDISANAKLLYAALVSVHRTPNAPAPTQTEIGEKIGLSRHKVWRAQCELIEAGLLVVRRPGQGNPNSYELAGVAQADLDGTTRSHSVAGHQEPRPSPGRRSSWSAARKNPGRDGYRDTSQQDYDVAASIARELSTYQEAGARYGAYCGRYGAAVKR